METSQIQELDLNSNASIGSEDWRYVFAAGQVRTLDSMMLSRATLIDMANSPDFAQALECLSGTEYAVTQSKPTLSDVEEVLIERRSEVRKLFSDLMVDEPLSNLVKARADFTNMRLAVRRLVTEKAIGTDYSDDGSVSASIFEEVFEQENYSEFPEYMQNAVEAAVLSYYENKDIRQIDYAISSVMTEHVIKKANELKCQFLSGLTRSRIDLDNIRTMLRLKFSGSDERGPFLANGFVKTDMFVHGLDLGYEGLDSLFYPTPYHHIVEAGVSYLNSNGSFLRLESLCDRFLWDIYKSAMLVTAGPQPVIAYLLKKEQEIRTVRMILTGKRNLLPSDLLLDRLGESDS